MRFAALALLALAGCSTAPGTGWSRADDFSVYSTMRVFARAAQDQEIYCAGFSPASARDHFERDFGARDAAVTAAFRARHGDDAIAEAGRVYAPRVACGDVPDRQWRDRYARLLRLLEIRLELAAEGES
jgi:hypothetical protein